MVENDPLVILLAAAAAAMAFGTVAAATCARRPRVAVKFGYGSATLASALLAIAATGLLLNPHAVRMDFGTVFGPVSAAYTLLLDPLAAFFLLLIGVGGLLCAPYALGYARPMPADEHRAATAWLAAGFNLFLLSMGAVVLANNAFLFLLAWELMSIVSYFLVSYHHEQAPVRHAGMLYVIVTHIGAAFILFAFILLAASNDASLSFDALRGVAHSSVGLSPSVRNIAFLCAVVGFGAKAGLMPLHFWLPRAHPVAPSHISALMSGVMLKIAIYGVMRMSFDLLGVGAPGTPGSTTETPPLWWGALLLALGLISAILGALYAVVESDMKRLLAFSSIENMGIVSMGLGAALLCCATPSSAMQALAGLAIVAACFHMLNHTAFKSLLFLVAGAVQHATHSTSLEALGGLVKRMPWTAICACVGALAIAGLPPFNGFVSEWLTYQALLGVALSSNEVLVKLAGVVAASGLALTAALAAATFLKVFGIGFLALPRSAAAEQAREVAPSMRLSMAASALLVAALGIGATGVLAVLAPVVTQILSPAASTGLRLTLWPTIPGASSVASGAPGGLATLLLVLPVALLPLAWGGSRWLAGPARARLAETWVCGQTLTPRMEYSAASFAKPLRRIFQMVLLPFREVRVTYASEPYVVERIEYRSGIASALDSALARMVRRLAARGVELVKTIQNGNIRLYLGYILATLVLLLLFAR